MCRHGLSGKRRNFGLEPKISSSSLVNNNLDEDYQEIRIVEVDSNSCLEISSASHAESKALCEDDMTQQEMHL